MARFGRDATRGQNRIPREKKRYAQRESATSGGFITRGEAVLQRGVLVDRRRGVDDPNTYNSGIIAPATFGGNA